MCLRIRTKTKTLSSAIASHKRVAKTDIIVYKRLRNYPVKWANQYGSGVIVKSPYMNFSYSLNTLYSNEGILTERFGFSFILIPLLHPCNYLYVSKGLHAYRSIKGAKRAIMSGTTYIMKCIIPKGSTYYFGDDDDEVCSDRLIITDESNHK